MSEPTDKNNNITDQPILECPHCKEYIVIEKINCAIFRHGVLKKNGKQIDPHASKEICEHYIKNDMIYGCGKPFRIIIKENVFYTEICDYI
jgi:hypothetical protein